MLVAVLVAIGCIAGAVYRLARRRQAESRAAPPLPPTNAKAGGRFGAVEIRSRGAACRAAHAIRGHRFLAKDAPSLPLQGCTLEQCACSFSKLKDRRSEGRRLDHGGLSASLFVATNRRQKKDRRRAAAAPQRT
jgi:hypothetical protein